MGHAAIELARWGEARVAATVSSAEKERPAAEAGAQLAVSYRTDGGVEAIRAWAPESSSASSRWRPEQRRTRR